MKLTKREKILLGILGVIVFLALDYLLLFKPQFERMKDLIDKQKSITIEVKKVKQEISAMDDLQKSLDEVNKEIEDKTRSFYPKIVQEKIIVILDELFKNAEMRSDANSFSVIQLSHVHEYKETVDDPFPAQELVEEYTSTVSNESKREVEGKKDSSRTDKKEDSGQKESKKIEEDTNLAENISVSIQFSTSYNQLMAFIKELESLNRTIVIKSITVTSQDNNNLKGNIHVDFYALPKIHKQDKEYFEWPYSNNYGTDNPFK